MDRLSRHDSRIISCHESVTTHARPCLSFPGVTNHLPCYPAPREGILCLGSKRWRHTRLISIQVSPFCSLCQVRNHQLPISHTYILSIYQHDFTIKSCSKHNPCFEHSYPLICCQTFLFLNLTSLRIRHQVNPQEQQSYPTS